MKKITGTVFVLWALLVVPAFSKANVVVTLPWIGSIVREIGKDKIDVTVLVKQNQDPHYIEAKPSLVVAARRADIIMYNGLDLEIGYLPVIVETSKNPRIQSGAPGNFDCSRYVAVIEKHPSADRSMGDVHPLGNPHYHFSPKNIGHVAEGMADVLSKGDPGNEAFYRANLVSFKERLTAKEKYWNSLPLKDRQFVCYHNIFSYLANEFGVKFVGSIEEKPGIPPSAKSIEGLIEKMKKAKPEAILVTSYDPQKQAQCISEKTGVKWIVVPHDVGAIEGANDWFSFMDRIVTLLEKGE